MRTTLNVLAMTVLCLAGGVLFELGFRTLDSFADPRVWYGVAGLAGSLALLAAGSAFAGRLVADALYWIAGWKE